jgi:hypothetical protein
LEQFAAQRITIVNHEAGLLSSSHLNSLSLNPIVSSKTPSQGAPAMWKTSHGNRFPESLSGTLCRHGDRIGPHLITAEDLTESTWQVCMDCGAALGRLTPQGTQTHAGSERMGPRADAMPRPIEREILWLLVPLPTSIP